MPRWGSGQACVVENYRVPLVDFHAGPSSGAADTRPAASPPAMTMPLKRLVPPASTLISDCPIKAQPPWPPVNPDAKFPSPWPMHSWRVLPLFPSSAMPSTNCKVNKLSTCVEIKILLRVRAESSRRL